jgi:hypothetical protein
VTREDIIRIAREELWGISAGRWLIPTEALERIVNRAVEAEREACARVCDKRGEQSRVDGWYRQSDAELRCADAIRARGSK